MNEQAQAWPLSWPIQRPRTASFERQIGKFNAKNEYGVSNGLTIAAAVHRLEEALRLLGVDEFIISSDLKVRLDGLPYSKQGAPTDPGVAVYFDLNNEPICMPCDTYTEIQQNIAAIAAHINATRAIDRYGVASVSEMFKGFAALPNPEKEDWRASLGFHPDDYITLEQVESQFKRLASIHHPDKPGGNAEMFSRIKKARDSAREALS